ncbi:MAG TPA: hypothetical protein VHN37_13430 [Actinomycetota bacterium]|nr:hypothetical protein [Actinomycetota bacterium]
MTGATRRGLTVAAALLLGAAGVWAVIETGDSGAPRPARGDHGPHLFLSGKHGDVWRVSAEGAVTHAKVPELDPGDPPHHLLARGDALLGWGYETYLLDPALDRAPEVLVDDSLFFIPSAREDRLWVATEEPGTNRRIASVREVTVDGEVTVPGVRPPGGGWPEASLEDGLVFFSRGRGVVWDPRTRRVVVRFPIAGDLGPTYGNVVAWCGPRCAELHLTDVSTGRDVVVSPPRGFRRFRGWEGAFSPDGSTIAVPLLAEDSHDVVLLGLVDVDDAVARAVPGTRTRELFNFVAWSASGSHVFFTGAVDSGSRTIFVYRTDDAGARSLDVEVGEFYDAAAL